MARKSAPSRIAESEDEDVVMGSQKDLFEDEEEVESHGDLFTQARTQVEGMFIPQKKAKKNSQMEGDEVAGRPVQSQSQRADRGDPDMAMYNPKPDVNEVQKVRETYATLNSEISQHRTQLLSHMGTEKIISLVASANNVMSKVHTTNEATLDSRFLSAIAELGAEKVQKLPLGLSDFALSDFISLVRNTLNQFEPVQMSQQVGEEQQAPWELVGRKASIFWRGVTTCDFLCGPIAVTAKEKAERRTKSAKKEAEPLKEFNGMTEEDFEAQVAVASASATSQNVIKVDQALNSYDEPIPFHLFITNPDSFPRSVENFFYCSFLVAEGRASIDIQDDGEIYISPALQESGEDGEGSGPTTRIKPKHQSVFNFSFSDWRKAIQKYSITEPLIEF